jgi:hypothetical protein
MYAFRPKDFAVEGPAKLIAAGAIGGGALVVAGGLLPWLSIYAGLESFRGVAGLNGRLLVGGGTFSVLLGLRYLQRREKPLLWAIGLLGAVLFGFSAWLVVQLFAVYRDVGGNPFLAGRLGPGLFISSAGAALILATLLVEPHRALENRQASGRATVTNTLLLPVALLSACAGLIHFAVLGEHLREYVLFGVFFATAGALQLLWALLLPIWPSRLLLVGGAVGNTLVVLLWIVSRTIGLPLGPGGATAPEQIGLPDSLTVVYECLLVVGALSILARGKYEPPMSPRTVRAGSWILLLVVIPLTLVGVLRAVGATSPLLHA